MEKTNVMRLLDTAGVKYEPREYDSAIVDGLSVARTLGEDPQSVFKTLVTESEKKTYFVFSIPVNAELNLKKAARAAGVKSIEMIPQKELLPLTGYLHGGCSPIGLKKPFPVFIDETAELFDIVFLSAGKRGFQVGLNPMDFSSYCKASFIDLVK
jgi:Cys-tRNA(Pro)/Cys-tRNA(Cys) deacylase